MTEENHWQFKVVCSPKDFDLFFSNAKGKRAQALALCGACPVSNQCLDHAIENNIEHGIFGGKTPEQRRKTNVK
jgi:WhiB family redox-sensing transcriptional regulator